MNQADSLLKRESRCCCVEPVFSLITHPEWEDKVLAGLTFSTSWAGDMFQWCYTCCRRGRQTVPLNVQKEHEIKQIFVIDSVVFPFDACSRLSLRSCCLLCLIPPLAPAPAHAPAACSAHSRRFLPAPVARSRSLRSLSPHAPAEFSLPPLVQLPIAPAVQSLLTHRSFHSASAARPLRRDQRRHFQPAAHIRPH